MTPAPRPDAGLIRQMVSQARADLGLQEITAEPRDGGPAVSERSGRHRLVAITRRPEMEEKRAELPIISMEQEIVEAVLEHDVVVLSGETGCGKTTQVRLIQHDCAFLQSHVIHICNTEHLWSSLLAARVCMHIVYERLGAGLEALPDLPKITSIRPTSARASAAFLSCSAPSHAHFSIFDGRQARFSASC